MKSYVKKNSYKYKSYLEKCSHYIVKLSILEDFNKENYYKKFIIAI